MQKKAVVDIDNTLWHFCDVLYERLKEKNRKIPPPDYWVDWDFWMEYCTEEEFMKAIHSIHLSQDDERHLPYTDAKDFLVSLRNHNFHIIIASHRTAESSVQTKRWLLRHGLIFDEIHLSFDKTILFDETCNVVIDDSPLILEKAAAKGLTASGLSFPWNRDHKNNGYKLFDNLNEILRHVLEGFSEKKNF